MESIPLHLTRSHIRADKILPIAEEHTVCDSVDIRADKVGDAGVTCVARVGGICVANELCPDLRPDTICTNEHIAPILAPIGQSCPDLQAGSEISDLQQG